MAGTTGGRRPGRVLGLGLGAAVLATSTVVGLLYFQTGPRPDGLYGPYEEIPLFVAGEDSALAVDTAAADSLLGSFSTPGEMTADYSRPPVAPPPVRPEDSAGRHGNAAAFDRPLP